MNNTSELKNAADGTDTLTESDRDLSVGEKPVEEAILDDKAGGDCQPLQKAPKSNSPNSDKSMNNPDIVISNCGDAPATESKNSDLQFELKQDENLQVINVACGSKTLLDRLSGTSSTKSPKTPLSTEDSEDIELKWDDDEDDEEFLNDDKVSSQISDDKEDKIDNDFDMTSTDKSFVDKDLIQEIDKQISVLDSDLKNLDDSIEFDNKNQSDSLDESALKDVDSIDDDENRKTVSSKEESNPDSDLKISESKKDMSKLSRETDTSKTITSEEFNMSDDIKLDSDGSKISIQNIDNVKLILDSVAVKLDEIVDKSDKELQISSSIAKGDGDELNLDSEVSKNIMDVDADANASIDEDKILESPVNEGNELDLLDDLDTEITDDKIAANSTILDIVMDSKDSEKVTEDKSNKTYIDTSLSLGNDSILIGPRDHNLKKPNMMIEIPTQELIDCDSSNNTTDSDSENNKALVDDDFSTAGINEYSEKEILESDSKMDIDSNDMASENVNTISALDVVDTDNLRDIVNDVDATENIPKEFENRSKEEITEAESSKLNNDKSKELTSDIPEMDTENRSKEEITEAESSKLNNDKSKELTSDIPEMDTEMTPLCETSTEKDLTVVTTEKVLASTEKDLGIKSPEVELAIAFTSADPASKVKINDFDDAVPSTSGGIVQDSNKNLEGEKSPPMEADTSDEVPDLSDSLGLLAESSRVMEDEEEEETSEHDDDEDEFEHDDESSNQMAAEYSEDSNAVQSETDIAKDKQIESQTNLEVTEENLDSNNKAPIECDEAPMDSPIETPIDTPELEKTEFTFDDDAVIGVEGQAGAEDAVCEEMDISSVVVEAGKDESTVVEQPTEPVDVTVPEVSTESEMISNEDEKPLESSDVETLKVSDTSDIEKAADKTTEAPSERLKTLLMKLSEAKEGNSDSPALNKRLQLTTTKTTDIYNIVDLGESSSEEAEPAEVGDGAAAQEAETTDDVTADVMEVQDDEPKDKAETSDKLTYSLNLSEVTIKTASNKEPMVIPELKQSMDVSKEKSNLMSLEVFNLDSDEEDATPDAAPPAQDQQKPSTNRCINSSCPSGGSEPYLAADRAAISYYEPNRKRKGVVCRPCALHVATRVESLIEGVRNLTPLLELDVGRINLQDLVEISDSDSDSEPDSAVAAKGIGAEAARLLEDQLSDTLNEVWKKYKMDDRLKQTQDDFYAEIDRLDSDMKKIDVMLRECQSETDRQRNELYATFEPDRKELAGLAIYTTPDKDYACAESVDLRSVKIPKNHGSQVEQQPVLRPLKRRISDLKESAVKRPAIPMGYEPLENKPQEPKPTILQENTIDDDKDVSVVTLSAESAPAGLPACGECVRPALRARAAVFAMHRTTQAPWVRGTIEEVLPKGHSQFTYCRVRYETKQQKSLNKLLPARCIAYCEPPSARMTIGTRCIAVYQESDTTAPRKASFFSGIVAEVPNPVNSYRYLIFFDDGYTQYVNHGDTRLVCESSPLVWEEVQPMSREFVRQYLVAYPERPMVRLHRGQNLKTERDGKWYDSVVVKVDASLVQVLFISMKKMEWIYRGSTRLAPLFKELQAAERHRNRPMPRNRAQNKVNMPYVEYTRYEDNRSQASNQQAAAQQQEELRRHQRAVAKKSTTTVVTAPAPPVPALPDTVTSRVVYYTPKNAVRPLKMVLHSCSPKCKRTDVLALNDLRTYNPLAKPLLSGWERQLVRLKGRKEVVYRAPCGRRVRDISELHRYLRLVQSDMAVDLFDFHPGTHCLAEFVLNKCIVAKKDLSNGKENVPVPCVNYYDKTLPEFCSYNTERTPTEGVPLNIDPEFLCGCDCTDDCMDKSKCACWKLTLEGARTIGLDSDVGYVYKRLPDPLPSGIYECNSRCKCKNTCLNRVAQHPLQLKLQVFKTLNRGWGIRALNDVPKGAFLCVYAGNLLTDATANLDGLNEGDEYLAELDYIEVVEQMKEGYEDDIPDADKKLDKKESNSDATTEESSSEEEMMPSKDEQDDGDFEPGYVPLKVQTFSKRLRKRGKGNKEDQDKDAEKTKTEKNKDKEEGKDDDGFITISDDEEVREPSRFMAQAGMVGGTFVSKYKSVRALYGKDEACYIMDAKVQGNIGRYLNHSCCPNVFVQNVFVDTHDPRFPWVAFFALLPIRAGTELTWNYNYDVGSVPGKVLYCHCQAPNCRGRLL